MKRLLSYHLCIVRDYYSIRAQSIVYHIKSREQNRTEVYIMNIRRTIECIEIIFEKISANIIIIEQ